ncbi:hypothetical protein KY290_035065 [Solanum tuberosum]|uniref:MBD domain-containing protein n=2 Tax=Solanum tuberosum TaxID=4113 RepID=A0ABQ7U6W1_SOLTU|nr:hypothetical protein KY289_034489 [Solanum tuberosum]KAH0646312.1 hypothetical protein KY284_034196 [Solanum tuberosum]KAH0649079.1 hypothetical protein KY285_034327 [Solanum tuberosum]KAH0742022.1 hypothetical protein KY290_035065 [Solanum tuberosum]
MTKADTGISFMPPTIITNDDCCNDGKSSDPLLPPGTYIEVDLDVRAETITPIKGDVHDEGKVSDVTRSKLQTKKMIMPMRQVNLDRPQWLPENWGFEIKVRTGGATVGRIDRFYIEPVSKSKCRSKIKVDDFLKTGRKSKSTKFDLNCDGAAPSKEKKIEEEQLEKGKKEC